MDPALLAQLRAPSWDRLSRLARASRLSPAEAEEFLALYRAASKDLSALQSSAPDSEISLRLSNIVHRARTQLTGVPAGATAAVSRYFLVSLPAALYSLRWYFVGVFAFFTAIALATTAWALADPHVMDLLGPEEARRRLAEHDFVDYYREHPNGFFAVGVWTNNAWLAIQWVVLGITGAYVVLGLVSNAVNVGVSAAILFDYGKGADFFAFILPHGIPEVTCILLAAAAGLKIFTAWMIPGPRRRSAALALEARSLIAVALGLVLFLFCSGLIEGFVTPSHLPVAVKIALGLLLASGIVAYALALGRPAERAGLSGDIARERAGYDIVAVD
ncbi:stage II sporulation protein M [Brevibacterium sp. 5221]|uniref:Stage II sporulation protein M n=1 Tax=Brevibacterium rongguiense TaxID=2695267 RepID=A0A6N9HAK4_9MICO|nr:MULTISPECIES: stage II sporulation protein M [Brevibacterium]MYM20826.1 stage II sporulation protein M [Brevibacterium rongguiense]WAL40333.1 stage II sporulation protein M [Brevibacterium sp. BRM-1]